MKSIIDYTFSPVYQNINGKKIYYPWFEKIGLLYLLEKTNRLYKNEPLFIVFCGVCHRIRLYTYYYISHFQVCLKCNR